METQCERVTLTSWKEFRDYLTSDRRINWPIYRGQREPTWRLASPFERFMLEKMRLKGIYPYDPAAPGLVTSHGPEYYAKRRGSALNKFQDLASGCDAPDIRTLSEIEWWVLGRHYGLITPILDWSLSPYVASFFAFRDFVESVGLASGRTMGGYISVWELDVTLIEQSTQRSELEVIHDPRMPWLGRSRAQSSFYTSLNHPDIYELEGFLVSRGAASALRQILIPESSFSTAIKDLARMNITSRFIYDDLSGAAEEANWRAFRGDVYMGVEHGSRHQDTEW